jgi:hypothetical protein
MEYGLMTKTIPPLSSLSPLHKSQRRQMRYRLPLPHPNPLALTLYITQHPHIRTLAKYLVEINISISQLQSIEIRINL